MLSQEEIYQSLYRKEFGTIINKLVNNREYIKNEPVVAHSINMFMDELFRHLEEKPLTVEFKAHLDTLFIMHAKGYYILPNAYALKLITIVWEGQTDEIFYTVAKLFPEDPVCKTIITKFEYKTAEINWKMNNSSNYVSSTGSQYTTEIKQFAPDRDPYLKVHIRDLSKIEIVHELLNRLSSVRTANIYEKNGKNVNLTVYERPPYTLAETMDEVELALDNYFSGSTFDPIFKDSVISTISDTAYYQIMDYMILYGNSLSRIKGTTEKWDEEGYRNYLILSLDCLSAQHSVTGETYNYGGKSDILVRDDKKNNLLIAECKLWKGENYLKEAIDQLFERYIQWMDEKTALVIFNTSVKGFTQLIEKALSTVKSHPLYHAITKKRSEQSYSFIFKNLDDPDKLIKLELILFNMY
jgi:hypothetical protein